MLVRLGLIAQFLMRRVSKKLVVLAHSFRFTTSALRDYIDYYFTREHAVLHSVQAMRHMLPVEQIKPHALRFIPRAAVFPPALKGNAI